MSNENTFARSPVNDRERDRNRRENRGGGGERRSGARDRSPIRSRANKGDCRVFVSNLPYDYRWQDLKDLLRKEVGDVAFVELFSDENDKSKGCGIVEFDSPESVKKCIEKLHRYEIDGRKIIVKEDNGANRDRFGGGPRSGRDRDREDRHWEGGRDLQSGKPFVWGETYGLSPSFLEGLGIAPPLVCRVFVANLDYKVTEKKLREVFKLAGKVRDVELSVDADGKSRGFAVVEYDHPVESVQAISMLHNQPLYDRRLTVRMDRVDPFDGNSRLPEGLHNIGMGLGANGAPLRDVAKNLPSLANVGNNLGSLQAQNNFNNLTAAAALSAAAAVPPLAGLQQQAAALQAAAALNTGNNSLLGPTGNLDLLARTTNDLTARDLALSNLANLGGNLVGQPNLNSSLGGGNGGGSLNNAGSGRDGFNERDLRSLSGNSNFGSTTARNNNIGGSGPKAYDTVVVDNVRWKGGMPW
ncbi:UNVERIFIED_CONTAM: hypothetical protein PYX00_007994 [Menopon gallinae]|uniref:RRM domain-containing protein n=1 Tax=Menopon gallinae TaxID=328185 RepID=A0AAW2HLG3_9NEOP